MALQTTLRTSVSCAGIGLHSGQTATLTLHPAAANTGIVFRRRDVTGRSSLVPARHDRVVDTRLGTTLENARGTRVATVEHLMAALWGAGVDDAIVELNGPEVPIMDGSSAPFMEMFAQAGLRRLDAPRKVLRVLKEVTVRQGASLARVAPYEGEDFGCSLELEIDYNHAVVKRGHAAYDFPAESFGTLAAARTFGFAHEVEQLRAAGLARGGSLDNAIVVGDTGVLNAEGLRFADEFIRHKALDCLGDLYLAGCRIEGGFSFTRPGHGVNNALLRALLADKDAWRLVTTAPARKVDAEAYAFA